MRGFFLSQKVQKTAKSAKNIKKNIPKITIITAKKL